MPIVPILCVVLLIVGVIAVVMSRENWHWQNITLVSLLLVFGLVAFFLVAKNLKIQESWRNEVAAYEDALAKEEATNKSLRESEFDGEKWVKPSLNMLRREVQTILQGRGRVWRQVMCNSVDLDTGVLNAVIGQPEQHGIQEHTLLFVFDGAPATDGGEFLGEFEATAVDGPQVQLSPVLPLRESEIQRLGERPRKPLWLYEIMPTDSYDLFAQLDPAIRKSVFPDTVPDQVKQEFGKDSSPPAPNEPNTDRIWRRVKALREFTVSLGTGDEEEAQTVSEGTELILDPKSAEELIAAGDVAPVEGNDKVYRRELRDYARLFRDLNLQIDSVLRSTEEVDRQLAVVQDAQRKVDDDIAYRNREIEALNSDLARFEAERDAIKKHVAALEQSLANVRTQLKKVYNDNLRLEAELVTATYDAVQKIGRRVAGVE